MEIPLFPLHAVLMPGAPLPLHIFEQRYRALVSDCMASGGPLGVVCITSGREAGPGLVSFAKVGTLAEIREVTRLPDGRFDIVALGTARFRLSDVDASARPYLVGTGELLPELLGDPERATRLATRVRSRFVRYLELLRPLGDDVDAEPEAGAGPAPDSPAGSASAPDPDPGPTATSLQEIAEHIAPFDDPTALAHVVGGLVQAELPRRQDLLEAATTEERLVGLDELLAREVALLARRLAPYGPDTRLAALRRN